MGQLIWRYHPEKKIYEIFAEGGGNAWGLEIDAKGRVFSGHNGGDTRGFHYVQGGYSQKGFGKHGPLSNPYSFGYFPPMKHPSVPRFTHAFVIYEGASLPEAHWGKLFGVAPLQGHVVESDFFPDGTTFQTKDIGHPVTTTDSWFRPVNIKVGPDGAIYVADMYEGQIAHLRHHEGIIDNTNGRIYRLQKKGAKPEAPFNLGKQSSKELVATLEHPNKWYRETALRLLADRRDSSLVPGLVQRLDEAKGQTALELLWAIHLSGGFNEDVGRQALAHPDPFVRSWTIRFLGDQHQVAEETANRLIDGALHEKDAAVRSQYASTSKRLPAAVGLRIDRQLLTHDEDVNDPHIPLLIWWGIESHCADHRDDVVKMFDDSVIWRLPMVQQHLLKRVMQRFAATGSRADLLGCAKLLTYAPDKPSAEKLMAGFEEAFKGRPLAGLPTELFEALAKSGVASPALALRQGKTEALEHALSVIRDEKADKGRRIEFVQILGEVRQPKCVATLLDTLDKTQDDAVRMAILTALQAYDLPEVGQRVIALYSKLSPDALVAAQTLLASRKGWALQLLEAVDAGAIDKSSLPAVLVRKLTIHRDDRIRQLVAKNWGQIEGETSEQMQQQFAKLQSVLHQGTGNPYNGKKLFTATCAKCHRLFTEGGQIGPDLTAYKRDDVANILLNVVNPSAEIREGFENYLAVTTDGRTVNGFLVDKDKQVLVLRGVDGQNITLAQDQVDELLPQKVSLMPAGLLTTLTDQQVRDLFAYLRSSQPLNEQP
jgi:putative heme-binding domain-containing protein